MRLMAYNSKAINPRTLYSSSSFHRQALIIHSLPGGYMKRDREGKGIAFTDCVTLGLYFLCPRVPQDKAFLSFPFLYSL
jgi:hypothetical protein